MKIHGIPCHFFCVNSSMAVVALRVGFAAALAAPLVSAADAETPMLRRGLKFGQHVAEADATAAPTAAQETVAPTAAQATSAGSCYVVGVTITVCDVPEDDCIDDGANAANTWYPPGYTVIEDEDPGCVDNQDCGLHTKKIVDLSKVHSEGRIISFLEGGYDLIALSESIKEHLRALKF